MYNKTIMKVEIVLNKGYGGFSLSKQALDLYNQRSGNNLEWEHSISRDDPILVQIVKELGVKANGSYSNLRVVELNVDYNIESEDGYESVTIRGYEA